MKFERMPWQVSIAALGREGAVRQMAECEQRCRRELRKRHPKALIEMTREQPTAKWLSGCVTAHFE